MDYSFRALKQVTTSVSTPDDLLTIVTIALIKPSSEKTSVSALRKKTVNEILPVLHKAIKGTVDLAKVRPTHVHEVRPGPAHGELEGVCEDAVGQGAEQECSVGLRDKQSCCISGVDFSDRVFF